MTAKRSNGKGVSPTPTQTVDAEGFLCLQGTMFWKYRALDAEYKNTVLAHSQKKLAFEQELKKYPELLKLRAEMTGLEIVARQQETQVKEMNAELEQTLGVSLVNCSIDDKTGRIFVLQENGPPTPMAPARVRKQRGAKTS